MSMQIQPYSENEVRFDRNWLEFVLLELGDVFNIRVVWDNESAKAAGLLALAGGLVGAFFGGRTGAALGAGVGGAAGFMSQAKPLREIWSCVKETLQDLLYIVYNFLRKLDAIDYINAFQIVMACVEKRESLVKIILNFITETLRRQVLSSLTV